jgi:pimeloyl-ACP methyl ester carboxylesterase
MQQMQFLGRPRGYPDLACAPRRAGEPRVLLHGLNESHIGWRPVIDALSKDYDVIAIDLPGFGRSPALPAAVSPTAINLAAAVERTLDEHGIGAYHVAGYSPGARVAIQLADSDVAMALAPVDGWFPAGRSLFLAGTRSLPWQIARADAKQLLTD